MPQPIVTLTTDFGLADHFVGVMKGVILSICPEAHLVDISHGVAPFAITQGAFLIAQAYRYFPKKTVHVVVVDPGVGTARRPILLEAAGQYFIAPDNGVLAMIYSREKHKVRAITNDKFFLKPVSQTFHGRDIFAPAAAHLATGAAPARMGKRIEDYVRPFFVKPQPAGKRSWSGRVLNIDRFGNIITNFHVDDFPDLARRPFLVTLGSRHVDRLARNYAARRSGELFMIAGSSGYLEVSVNQQSAAQMTGCEIGALVTLKIH
jgi:S-adenosyl-L-methionine hydrolase (adenosine-forming)